MTYEKKRNIGVSGLCLEWAKKRPQTAGLYLRALKSGMRPKKSKDNKNTKNRIGKRRRRKTRSTRTLTHCVAQKKKMSKNLDAGQAEAISDPTGPDKPSGTYLFYI